MIAIVGLALVLLLSMPTTTTVTEAAAAAAPSAATASLTSIVDASHAEWTPQQRQFANQLNGAMQRIEQTCLGKCNTDANDQNRTDDLATSLQIYQSCGPNCFVQQCSVGCQLWKDALDASCKDACNTTTADVQMVSAVAAQGAEVKELHCIVSCNTALAAYFDWLMVAVGMPAAPVLVADTLTATSLSLEWELPERLVAFTSLPGRRPLITDSYLVQWRYEEMAGDWKFCRNQSIARNNGTVRVDNLHPYTKYRFRIALVLSKQHHRELFSAQSVIISTRAAGRPASEPASVRATAVDHARISVSWEPGAFPNGKLLAYELRITEQTTTQTTTTTAAAAGASKGYEAIQNLQANDTFHMITGLHPNTTYNVTVRMVNEVGPGPAGNAHITTPLAPPPSPDGQPHATLILAGTQQVQARANDVLAMQTKTIFVSAAPIVGVAIHVQRNRLFVADAEANVRSVPLDGSSSGAAPKEAEVLLRSRATQRLGGTPQLLSIDWLNDLLYMLIEDDPQMAFDSDDDDDEEADDEDPMADDPFDWPRKWHIARCHLNGSGESVVLAELPNPPAHFEVDPYNGFLFWTVAGRPNETHAGLYRLDLADVQGTQSAAAGELLLGRYRLGPFTIDYEHFKLLVPLLDHDRIVALSFNGRSVHDVRNRTSTRNNMNLSTLRSIATDAELFYWTSGGLLWKDELHQREHTYYQNSRNEPFYSTLRYIRINATSAQPAPKPITAPGHVEAIVSERGVRLAWCAPERLPWQGRGAWRAWQYLLEIVAEPRDAAVLEETVATVNLSGAARLVEDGNGTLRYALDGLRPNTTYRFRVAAFAGVGEHGPWSRAFRVRTLRDSTAVARGAAERRLIWSSTVFGLLQTDVLGERTVELMPAVIDARAENATASTEVLKPRRSAVPMAVSSMAWHEDTLFIVSNGTLSRLNLSEATANATLVEALRGVRVRSVAVDWIGERLLWLNGDKQTVYRGSLFGHEAEPIFFVSAGGDIDMQVDAAGGWLYYATAASVTACRLNGQHQHVYYVMEVLYEGKQVMGLTLDTDARRVYWIGRGHDGSSLFSAPMLGMHHQAALTLPPMPGRFDEHPLSANIHGPLAYFADRLVWLQDEHTVVVGNLTGANVVSMHNERLRSLRAILAVDATLRQRPMSASVRPLAVRSESVRVQAGQWPAFNVTWAPATGVTYGEVFYEVRFLNVLLSDVRETSVRYVNATLPPYTAFQVHVRAYTYWANAAPARADLRTPPARPGVPQRLRVFLQRRVSVFEGQQQQQDQQRMEARVRWTAPASTNGPLAGYALYAWREDGDRRVDVLHDLHVPADRLEHVLPALDQRCIYYVQVQAVSATAGRGERSAAFRFNASEERVLPELRASRPGDIVSVDLDLNVTRVLTSTGTTAAVRHLAQIAAEERMFWANNENNELVAWDGRSKQKLYTAGGPVLSLCVDWVQRVLYWAQQEPMAGVVAPTTGVHLEVNKPPNVAVGGSTIYALDLNHGSAAQPQFIAHRAGVVRSLVVAPAQELLLWQETSNVVWSSVIYKHNVRTNVTVEFVGGASGTDQHNVLLDTRSADETRIVFTGRDGKLYATRLSADVAVPVPLIVQTATTQRDAMKSGSSSDNLVIDSERFYWLQGDTVHSNDGLRMRVPHAVELFAPQPQPYPPLHCLLPQQPDSGYTVSLLAATSESLHIQLPAPQRPASCPQRPAIAGTAYTIVYGPLLPTDNPLQPARCTAATCRTLRTFATHLRLTGLRAFRAYKLHVAVSNFYAHRSGAPPAPLGPAVVYRTAIGAPSAPRNLSVTVLSPTALRVQWLPAVLLNADRVWYEVLWQTQQQVGDAGGSGAGGTGAGGAGGGVLMKNQQRFIASATATATTTDPTMRTRSGSVAFASDPDALMEYTLTGLMPAQLYSVAVKASTGAATYNQTASVELRTLAEPAAVRLLEATAFSLRLRWPRFAAAKRFVVQCNELLDVSRNVTVFDSAADGFNNRSIDADEYMIEGLRPMTRYRISIWLFFQSADGVPYRWPPVAAVSSTVVSAAVAPSAIGGSPAASVPIVANAGDARGFVFSTLGAVPMAPSRPKIELVKNGVYKITWEPARDNGSPILEYRLEAWSKTWTTTTTTSTTTTPTTTTTTTTALATTEDIESTTMLPYIPRRVKRLAHHEDDTDDTAAATAHDPSASRQKPDAPAARSIDPTQRDTLNYTRTVPSAPRDVDIGAERDADDDEADAWRIVYNGTDSYWIIDDAVLPDIRAAFRVRARNAIGWSAFSAESEPVGEHVVATDRNTLLLVIAVPVAAVTLVVVLLVCGIFVCQCRVAEKKPFADGGHSGLHAGLNGTANGQHLHHHHHHHHHGPGGSSGAGGHLGNGNGAGAFGGLGVGATVLRLPDVELATLRELPRIGHHMLHPNQLYAHGPLSDADIDRLPQIRRDHITIEKQLGSGQFGDVYQGKVRQQSDESAGNDASAAMMTRDVAIKTLKKGASQHDKEDFLKEALVMNNFKHRHITQLIGVCFYDDELYIVMELMQGGDLLEFLRESRGTADKPAALTLHDLVSMCADIAAGCDYLEEKHFVHRDLACRNCLVSSVDPVERVVKIGDFGLARDIYKNDYYRTNGKKALPVRWMAPESLVDNVFTSQSDIWSFGVLCWEVMTFGQRPYPTRDNEQVMQFVAGGQRLQPPAICPAELRQLMRDCWHAKADARPTFRHCHAVLRALTERLAAAERVQQAQLAATEAGLMAGGRIVASRVQNGGVSNLTYFQADENHNQKKTGNLHICTDGHDLIEPPILVTPTSSKGGSPSPVPKYLDMLCDIEHIRCGNGDCECDTHDVHQHNDSGIDEAAGGAMAYNAAGDDDDDDEITGQRVPFVCNGYEIPLQRVADADDDDDDDRCDDDAEEVITENGDEFHLHATPTQQHQQQQHLTQSQRRRDLQRNSADKERTFSSSSTVSEHTVFPTGADPATAAAAAAAAAQMTIEHGTMRLHVALPQEDCSSRETLLQHAQPANGAANASAGGPVSAAPTAGQSLGRRGSQRRRSGGRQNSLKRRPQQALHAATASVVFGGCNEAKTVM